uniref:UDP-N-acetylglucosamine 2-epimerase n=1 Tax=Flavobacterium sp. TaxID=239 RepID=UPI004048B11C
KEAIEVQSVAKRSTSDVYGGGNAGNIDEKVRHSITKLADYHFVASENAKERVIKLGENPEFVFNTGCPSIDLAKGVIETSATLPFNPYEKYGGVGFSPDLSNGYLVVMQHPVTNEYQDSRKHIEATLEAVYQLNRPTLWFWPNVDAGADGTSNGIRAYRETHQLPNVHFLKNMEGKDFLHLLHHADCLIGNSSVGIRECAYLGVPVVNIGSRQNRRDRGSNVVDVTYEVQAIKEAIEVQSVAKRSTSDVYGGGNAGNQIADLLAQLPLQFHKTIMY